MNSPFILAIDTSCDDTSAAVTSGRRVLSNVISSQEDLHRKYGGVMPSLAKLEHQQRIGPVVELALQRAHITATELDAIAVTAGPGLAIALEVGIDYAQQFASQFNKPLLPINHMEGHLLSALAQNRVGRGSQLESEKELSGAMGLLISGGHSEFVLVNEIGNYKRVGQTLDDACGEAFDKSARLLGLGYPGAGVLSQFAQDVRAAYKVVLEPSSQTLQIKLVPRRSSVLLDALLAQGIEFKLPVPMAYSSDLNMSFSGLKTAFWQLVQQISNHLTAENKTKFEQERVQGVALPPEITKLLCLLFESAAVHVLTAKLKHAITTYHPPVVIIGGGVVNNVYLRRKLRHVCQEHDVKLAIPYTAKLFRDNAAMIGIAANYQLQEEQSRGEFERRPNWQIGQV